MYAEIINNPSCTFTMQLETELPPSDNKLYTTFRNRRILTKAGRQVKNQVKGLIATAMAQYVFNDRAAPSKNVPYEMSITIYFDQIENKSWGKNPKTTRYKKVDAQNRQKLIIDAVTDALGIDDSIIFSLTIRKKCDPNRPRIKVWINEIH